MTEAASISEYIARQEFVALDTETTGIWAPAHRVVEIAAVKFKLGGTITSQFESFVNPERSMPPEVIKIHGITDEMLADAPDAKLVWQRFIEFCGDDSILVAHNAPFDVSFVGCELDREKLTIPENPCLDTIDLYQRFHPGLGSYSLLSLVKHFGIGTSQAHRALSDARYVKLLVEHIAPQLGQYQSRQELLRRVTSLHLSTWKSEPGNFPESMADLENAVNNRLRIQIVYKGNGQAAMERIIRPRGAHGLGTRIYIMAFCEEMQAERTFRIDRIKSYRILGN